MSYTINYGDSKNKNGQKNNLKKQPHSAKRGHQAPAFRQDLSTDKMMYLLLSGGQRQAASLLMATVAQPKLLLLDEHTAALDPGAAEKVMEIAGQIVARDKITAMMITHDMDHALSMGSRTIMLDAGKIVLDLSGPKRQAMTAGALAKQIVQFPLPIFIRLDMQACP